jgi:hypothetical protein
MSARLLHAIRRNLVSFTALFFALTGTGIAAVALSNHSIDPIKLNPKYIGGYVRSWASVNADGRVVASGGRVSVREELNVFPGRYYFRWQTRLTSPCTAIGSVDDGAGNTPGYLTAGLAAPPRTQPTSVVDTFNAQGQPANQPFEVELLCATPR